jgi:hypothetical protein
MIARFAHDNFIRPYLGDFLVVMLLYCFLKSFCNIPVLKAAIFVLLFSYGIEILQYFQIAERLGFKNHGIAKIIIGTSFEWTDMLMYTAGIGVVVLTEKFFS